MIPVYGAILGDIVGSPYEFDCNNCKTKDFPLFSRRSQFTDDTVMTLAVAKALLDTHRQEDAAIKAALVREMQRLGRLYPDRGYGARFEGWLYEEDPQSYHSYGNGSAMRVSPAAWLAEDMTEALHLAQLTAEVTHDHPEGIRGAQAAPPSFLPARAAAGQISGRMWSVRSGMIWAAPVTRSAPPIVMWRAAGRQCRRPSLHFWKARVLRMHYARRYLSAATAIRWLPSPAASPRLFTACRRI